MRSVFVGSKLWGIKKEGKKEKTLNLRNVSLKCKPRGTNVQTFHLQEQNDLYWYDIYELRLLSQYWFYTKKIIILIITNLEIFRKYLHFSHNKFSHFVKNLNWNKKKFSVCPCFFFKHISILFGNPNKFCKPSKARG